MQKCIQKLVDLERDWIPDSKVASLYIRPTMIGTEPTLGVSVSQFSPKVSNENKRIETLNKGINSYILF